MYEPRISGFAIAGKRGSKYFVPAIGAIQPTTDKLKKLLEAIEKGKVTKNTEKGLNNSIHNR